MRPWKESANMVLAEMVIPVGPDDKYVGSTRPCIYCDSRLFTIVQKKTKWGQPIYAFTCSNCEARGPWADDIEKARTRMNGDQTEMEF